MPKATLTKSQKRMFERVATMSNAQIVLDATTKGFIVGFLVTVLQLILGESFGGSLVGGMIFFVSISVVLSIVITAVSLLERLSAKRKLRK